GATENPDTVSEPSGDPPHGTTAPADPSSPDDETNGPGAPTTASAGADMNASEGEDDTEADAEAEEDPDDPDDPSVEYDDLFGAPALKDDPPLEDGSGPSTDDGPERTDASGRSGDGATDPDGPTAQATVAEPTVRPSNGPSGIAQDWPQFVAAVREAHIRLGIFLGESEPVELTDGVLTLSVPRALHRDTMRDHQRVLLDRLTDTVDRRIEDIEIVVNGPTPTSDGAAEEPQPASPREQLQALRDTYPALEVLFGEFEAEPIW
ncbi:MAG: DNA polymerase III subunit gamma/tau, partial [Salinivenus sp.]